MTRNLPAHVQNALALDGSLDTGRVTATAKPRTCRTCGRRVLAGIVEGIGRRDVDPTPTTPLGELSAVLAGRDTYRLAAGQLVHRHAMRIAYADANTEAAYPEHRCGSPPLPANAATTPKPRPRPDYNQPPPF